MSAAPLWRLTRPAEGFLELLCLLALAFLGFAYFGAFSFDLDRYLYRDGLFQLALNSHDHLVYVATLEGMQANGIEYGLNNDFGIAAIYWMLTTAFPFLVNDRLTLLSFLFNLAVLVPTYVLWARICDHYGLGLKARLAFFLNTSLLYFLQLINKDLLTIFGFLLTIYAGIRERYLLLVLLMPLLFLVRQQLAVFAILFMFFMSAATPHRRILLAYVVTSVVAGLLSVFASVIGEESMGSGFSAFLVQLNTQYYIGYLVFNPLRVIQYLTDAYMSFWLFSDSGGIDVAKLLRLPQLILLAWLWKPCLELVKNFSYWNGTAAKPLMMTIVAYFLAWLMNPTINARYVMLITPVFILFALYVRKHQAASNREQMP